MGRKLQIKKKKLEQYEHKGKRRLNNPPVGLVNPQTDQDAPKIKILTSFPTNKTRLDFLTIHIRIMNV